MKDPKASYWKKKLNAEIKKRVTDEMFLEEIRQIIFSVKPLPPLEPASHEGAHRPHEAVLLFSDCQIGERVQNKETGFGEYNFKVFGRELERLYVSLMNIIEIHRKDYPVENLNIFMLGDIVEGTGNIFRGQGARIVTDVVEQCLDVGVPLITSFIQSLSRHFKNVKITCVPGNHGRLRKKDEDLTHTNWDYVSYRVLQMTTKEIPNVMWDITKQAWKLTKIFNWQFYLEHGDNINRYMQIPWYGFERRDGKLTLMHQMKQRIFHYYCIGHLHEPFEWQRPEGERICNGTFAVANPYALHKLAVSVHPIQKLFFVHPRVGKVCSYNIRLDLPRKYVK